MRLYAECMGWMKSRCVAASVLLVLWLCLPAFSGCTIVEEKEKKDDGKEDRLEYFKDEGFDADKVVEDIWESLVVPYVREKAVDLATLLDELAVDQDAAGERYGYREEGGDYPWNFLVKGEGRILAVNTQSRKGTLDVDLPPYDGKLDATLWIGPIIRSYSIRDALDFISFTDGVTGASGVQHKFDTQVQFAEVSNALNRRGNKNVLASLEPEFCFKLTERSLAKLKGDKLPDEVPAALGPLQDQLCAPKDAFWEKVQHQIGADAEQYRNAIFKRADAGDSGKGKLIRFYGGITPKKDAEVTPVLFEIVEEGQE